MVAQDASPKVGKALVERFAKHSAASFSSLLTYAGYKDIPTSWFFCEDDQCISPKLQMASIGAIEATGQQVECTRIKCGHCKLIFRQKSTRTVELLLWTTQDRSDATGRQSCQPGVRAVEETLLTSFRSPCNRANGIGGLDIELAAQLERVKT